MHPYIKYLYLLSVISSGCLLSACSSNETEEIDSGKGVEVSFVVPDQSRASITTTIDRFAVYGDMKLVGEATPSIINIFDKTEVVRKDDVWQYQESRYWFPNHEHSFVAVHPMTVLDDAQYSESKLSFSYTLPDSNEDAADIIAATHRRLYREGDAPSSVSLRFSHMLSLVNFTLELTETTTRSEECFKIHKLEMSGFGTSATINVEPATLQSNKETDDSKIDIVTTKGNGSLTVIFDEPIKVINGATAVKMFGGNNAIIMLPQTFAAGEEVEITLTYSVNDEAEETQVSANLSSFTWERGSSYNYKIKLELEPKDVNMVISETSIAPWNLVEGSDIVDAR